jgi:hypothetical protein
MIGPCDSKKIITRKLLDDADVVRKRAEQTVGILTGAARGTLSTLLPGIVSPPEKNDALRYRQISRRYGEDTRQDLTHTQLAGQRSWAEWWKIQRQYFTRLGLEYNREADKQRLSDELTALTGRQLDKWLAHTGTENLVIGAAERDRLYPPQEVATQAGNAGIEKVLVVPDATHNMQHFEPAKVVTFLREALGVGKTTPPRQEPDATLAV